MSKKKEKTKKVEPTFSKEQLIASKKYKDYQDALCVILKENESYTLIQADNLLDEFMKGKVK